MRSESEEMWEVCRVRGLVMLNRPSFNTLAGKEEGEEGKAGSEVMGSREWAMRRCKGAGEGWKMWDGGDGAP